ncbi:hypothetical protein BGX28_001401 [Mortierella sp. GBA30]|nr:hypothetical protein BGX28_001401 [Mortierella sp. GBA30]
MKHAFTKRGGRGLRRNDNSRQQTPQHHDHCHEIINNTPHTDLKFYDIHLATRESTLANATPEEEREHFSHLHSQPSLLKRRRNKRHTSKAAAKSRDVYADLVIVFKYKRPQTTNNNNSSTKEAPSKSELEEETLKAYEDVLRKLHHVGLQYETRPVGKETILIFILCPWSVLKREVNRNGIHDWLTGVKVGGAGEAEQMLQPADKRDNSLDYLKDADRIRVVHELITEIPMEGGAGIYPDENEYVESILPLHDRGYNKIWLKSWSTKWVLNKRDFSRIRDHFGEKVAYYFQFLEFYFFWLIFPTALGVLVHLFGSPFSIFYSTSVVLWAIIFIECWKRHEKDLALKWGVRNVRKSESIRPAFKGDSVVVDTITGEQTAFFSPWKRFARKLMGLPVIFAGALALSALVTLMFGVEVFLEVYYGGYMKEIMVYVPTVLYALAMPFVEDMCTTTAKMLTDYENYERAGSYDYHLVQKIFIFKVLNSYLAILLTAYVYIPFGPQIIALFQGYGLPFATVAIDPKMLQERLQAFMISNQAIGFFTETIFPWITRRVWTGAAKIQREVSEALHVHAEETSEEDEERVGQDPEEVREFLKSVQAEVELPVYDVNEDYGEMVEQFGYISLFSVIWPLTGLCAFVNNWVELRSDAAKICFHTRRPIPARTDTIGSWVENLEYLTWFSSLTNASILYLFRGANQYHASGSTETGFEMHFSLSMLLICLLASEHAYMALRWAVRVMLHSIPTKAELAVRRKEYGLKRGWLSKLNNTIGAKFGRTGSSSALTGMPVGPTPDLGVAAVSGLTAAVTAFAIGTPREEKESLQVKVEDNRGGCCSHGEEGGTRTPEENLLENDLGAHAIRSMFKAH